MGHLKARISSEELDWLETRFVENIRIIEKNCALSADKPEEDVDRAKNIIRKIRLALNVKPT